MASAVGRPTGAVTVSRNGLATYSFKIDVPPGIGKGNEPELSLEYSSGAPNGILGHSWSLAGLSSIRRGVVAHATDGINEPASYDRSLSRLLFSGSELLNITQSPYDKAGASYKTEIDPSHTTFTHDGEGFRSVDGSGYTHWYGSSKNSQIVSPDGVIVEYLLDKQSDTFGNFVSYSYTASPGVTDAAASLQDTCAAYISQIRYTSNGQTLGRRLVLFDYEARTDPVVHTFFGTRVVHAKRLCKINIAVVGDDSKPPTIVRSYNLSYKYSSSSGSSILSQLHEQSELGTKTSLIPYLFQYTGHTPQSSSSEPMFETKGVQHLSNTGDNVSMMPVNVSGRSLADLVALRYDNGSQHYSLKTFLTTDPSTAAAGSVQWTESNGDGAELSLPKLGKSPVILGADLNGDGRTDLVMPYENGSGQMSFAMCRSLGQGYQYKQSDDIDTGINWAKNPKMIAVDLDGNGKTDVIQIFDHESKLSYRIYSMVGVGPQSTTMEASAITKTDFDFTQTIDWRTINLQRNRSQCLLRIWARMPEPGSLDSRWELTATTFSLDPSSSTATASSDSRKLSYLSSCVLGHYAASDFPSISVNIMDINGDGVEDIIVSHLTTDDATSSLQMTFNLTTFLGDGKGSFLAHGSPQQFTYNGSTSEKPTKDGARYYVINAHGTDFPSLAYVYQQQSSRDYVGLIAAGSCSGIFQSLEFTKIVDSSNLPDQASTLSAADVTGAGLTSWIWYSMENGNFTVCPAQNNRQKSELLSCVRDPMGLKTEIQYRPMSYPGIYSSSVDWQDYSPADGTPDHPMLAAPTHIVCKLEVTNDPSISDIPFNHTLEMTYRGAMISSQGRGWQGFAEMSTFDRTANVTTVRNYAQSWPLSGKQISVRTYEGGPSDNNLVQENIVNFASVWRTMGDWKIYRVDKEAESQRMYQAGKIAKQSSSKFTYDEFGNLILDATTESDGRIRYSHYKWINEADGRIGLIAATKTSASASSTDFGSFQDGDISLNTFKGESRYSRDNEPLRVEASSEWSSDAKAFATTSFKYDAFGNLKERIDPAGLTTTYTYDHQFNSFPITAVQKGEGINLVQYVMFDQYSGQEIARRDFSGRIQAKRVDVYGRQVSIMKAAVRGEATASTVTLPKYLGDTAVVCDDAFNALLPSTTLCASESCQLKRIDTSNGGSVLCTSVTKYYGTSVESEVTIEEHVNCINKVCRRSIVQPDRLATWQYYAYDGRGLQVLQSFPMHLEPNANPLIAPPTESCLNRKYDCLERVVQEDRPRHNGKGAISTQYDYAEGGRKVIRRTLAHLPDFDTPQLLSTTEKYFETCNEDEKLVAIVDEKGAKTTFGFDLAGNLTKVTDPAGKVESRRYDSLGKLVATDDAHRGASSMKYDVAGHLLSVTNALGHTSNYSYNAKGRLLLETGHSGETIQYSYDVQDRISQILMKRPALKQYAETKFDHLYDERGRLIERTVTLSPTEVFTTKMGYDWQDQIVFQKNPDDSTLEKKYRGSLLESAVLKHQTTEVKAVFMQHNPFLAPSAWTLISNTGAAAFQYEYSSDAQGFPTKHSISSGSSGSAKVLASETYFTDDLDRLSRTHELISNETIDYQYDAGRLVGSTGRASGPCKYVYDLSGNLIEKAGTTLSHDQNSVTGKARDGTPISSTYDPTGRLTRRTVGSTTHEFQYDDFGNASSITAVAAGTATALLSDYRGETLMKTTADGTRQIFLGGDYELYIAPDGSRKTAHRLHGADRLLATLWTRSNDKSTSLETYFTGYKGNITHIFSGTDASLVRKINYEDFGQASLDPVISPDQDAKHAPGYEQKHCDPDTGLLDFGARWYDPLFGRFTTADPVLSESVLKLVDGCNYHAFENNNPINHVDPTGHWTLWSITALVFSVILIVAAIVVTAGLGGVVFGALAGGLLAAGISGTIYSIKHKDEPDWKKFAAGWGATVAIAFAVGAIAGGASAWISSTAGTAAFSSAANVISDTCGMALTQTGKLVLQRALSVGADAVVSAVQGAAMKLGENVVDKRINGKDIGYMDGVGEAFGLGAGVGALTSAGSSVLGPRLSKLIGSDGLPDSATAFIGFSAKRGGVALLKSGFKVGWGQDETQRLVGTATSWGKSAAGSLEKELHNPHAWDGFHPQL